MPLTTKYIEITQSEHDTMLERIDSLNAEIDRIKDLWERERKDIANDLIYLRDDIEENKDDARRAIIIYHHDCMCGTDCDACRIIWRINEIVKRLHPNAKITGPMPKENHE